MRKLASIQKVLSLEPIENADKIEKATILGWQLVCKKGDFSVNQLCVYVEIDSILPERPEFEFMRERKFRVKTIKLRGQVSQGICFPLSILPKGTYKEDQCVSEILGVLKYDPQAAMEQKMMDENALVHKNRIDKFLKRYNWYRKLIFRPDRMPFPKFIKKTDEDRIQLFPDICEREKDTLFTVTSKIDGQSGTYFIIRNPHKWQFWKKYLFGVCSRNFQLLKPDNSSYWTIAKQLDLRQKLTNLAKVLKADVVLQGEIIGSKIQANKYGISGYDFYAFNLIVNNNQIYDLFMRDECDRMNIKCVPLINSGFKLRPSIPEMVEYAKGKSKLADIHREGVVIRSYAKNISLKVINPDFLLKYSE